MNVITTTTARGRLAELVNLVSFSNKPIAIGRRNKAEVLLVKFPDQANSDFDDMTNMAQYAGGFSWLAAEPDIYTVADLKKKYV